MTYKYWISGTDVASFRVGDFPRHGISLQDYKHPMIFSQNTGIVYVSENVQFWKDQTSVKMVR
jgi:hypothetical protein